MKRWLTGALLLMLAGPVHAQDDPASDEAGMRMQMDRAEADLKNSSALIHDAALNAYIHRVACRLAREQCASLRIYVLDAPGFDIASLSNGAVVISSGAMLRAENEAQFAFFLGHAIAHYLDHDAMGEFDRKVNITGAAAVLGTAAAGAGIYFIGTAASLTALNVSYPFTLSEEREADRDGFARAVAAGYDPAEAPKIWNAIAAEEDANPKAQDIFLAGHPRPKDKLEQIENLAAAARGKTSDWILAAAPYHDATALFRTHWVEEELARGGESVLIFARLSADAPGSGLLRYALGEAYRKRNQPGDADKAREAFHAALSLPDAPALAWRGLGLMAMKAGDNGEARTALTQYRAKVPDADDKAMIDFYLARL